MIPWKDVSVGRRSFIGILIFRSVSGHKHFFGGKTSYLRLED
jgi:hypothetical protein